MLELYEALEVALYLVNTNRVTEVKATKEKSNINPCLLIRTHPQLKEQRGINPMIFFVH